MDVFVNSVFINLGLIFCGVVVIVVVVGLNLVIEFIINNLNGVKYGDIVVMVGYDLVNVKEIYYGVFLFWYLKCLGGIKFFEDVSIFKKCLYLY